ncbi:MAG: hypothetical protein GEU99_17695 [Luteitalea sp.]|nr:hypothetical protein [Luteitalea sp.]
MEHQVPETNAMSDERDPLHELLRLAGPRPAVPADRSARVRLAVRDRWHDTVRVRRRQRQGLFAAAVLAAAALMIVATRVTLRPPARPPAATPAAVIASVEAATGPFSLTEHTGRQDEAEVTLDPGNRLSSHPIHQGALVRTPAGTRAAIRLHGGVALRLDEATTVQLENDEDVVLEAGAVYVDTGDEGSSPRQRVEIRTPYGIARDVGTRFEVRRLASGVRVRVRDGLVRLQQETRCHEVRRGTELVTSSAGEVTRRTIPLQGVLWDWVSRAAPPANIEGKPLTAFLDWVEREGGWHVRFADASLARTAATTIVHGSIDGLTLEESLDVVLAACGLAHRIEGGSVVISSSRALRGDAREEGPR